MVEMVTPKMQEELLEVAKLVVSAAAKQTIETHGLVASERRPQVHARINKQAVGRLHNAARKARAALPADVVKAIEAKAAEDCGE